MRLIRSWFAVLLAILTCAPCLAGQRWDCPIGPNLVRNPGFEEIDGSAPSAWWAPEGYRIDPETARTGQVALTYSNSDPDRYLLCSQKIDLQPGGFYEIRAFVKTAGLRGDDSGATVCVEWSDADGKWMGGHYPEGSKEGAAGWYEVRGVSQVPEAAGSVTISCYLRKGMTGTAWWDDVSVRRWRQRPLEVLLLSPSYRGRLEEDASCVTARVNIGETGLDRERERLEISLTAASSGESVAKEVLAVPAEGRMQLRLPTRDPAVGPYWLKTRLVDVVTGETIDEVVNRLDRRRDSNPTCFIDRHNRVILNGQPFFPLGMYWSGVDEDQLRLYAGSPFNCLMPYGSPDREQMDLIQRAGLKVIYSIKDYYYGTTWCPDFIQSEADEEGAVRSRVREFRSHPALLAWYLNDERPLSMLPRLEAHQRWVEEEDPDHPTWIVLYQVGDVRRYERSFDAIGTDPYPIPDHPASMAGDWTRLTREAVADARSIWMVPQVFRREGKERPPTLAELRSMAWQCIAEGADGLIFYSWFELRRDRQFPFEQRWKEVKQVAGEIAAATPVLLSTDPVPDDIAVDAPEAVHWTARGFEGDVYLFLVNDSAGPVTAEVRLSGEAGQATLGDRSVSVGADGALTVAMEPYGVEVCRIENRPR